MKTYLLRVFGAVVLLYVAVSLWVYTCQAPLLFDTVTAAAHTPSEQELERLFQFQFTSPEGETLTVFHTHQTTTDKAIVLFGGSNSNAAELALRVARILPDTPIFVPSYRGYPFSTGTPSEESLQADGLQAYDEIMAQFAPKKMIVAGASLGTGVASYVGALRKTEKLLLIMPFDSLLRTAEWHYPFLPMSLILKHRFESVRALAGSPVPTAVLMVKDDDVVPNQRTLQLVKNLRHVVLFSTLEGTTHGTLLEDGRLKAWLHQALSLE